MKRSTSLGRMRPARPTTRVLIAAALVLAAAGPARAQAPSPSEPRQTPGWLVTPSFGLSTTWDDNVILAGQGGRRSSDGSR